MNEHVKALYQQALIARQKSEQGYLKRPEAQQMVEAYNPVCGDQFTIYFDLDSHRLSQVSFHGYGCAISKASTSLLVEELEGCTIQEAQKVLAEFLEFLEKGGQSDHDLKQALAMSKEFPGRSQCARLSWEALEEYFKQS